MARQRSSAFARLVETLEGLQELLQDPEVYRALSRQHMKRLRFNIRRHNAQEALRLLDLLEKDLDMFGRVIRLESLRRHLGIPRQNQQEPFLIAETDPEAGAPSEVNKQEYLQ